MKYYAINCLVILHAMQTTTKIGKLLIFTVEKDIN